MTPFSPLHVRQGELPQLPLPAANLLQSFLLARSDDVLRALIYKLVPGLYQRECERLVEFEQQHQDLDAGDVLKPAQSLEQEFFAPAEPIRWADLKVIRVSKKVVHIQAEYITLLTSILLYLIS